MIVVLSVFVFLLTLTFGIVIGAILKKEPRARDLKDRVVDILEPKKKAEIVEAKTDVQEAYVDKHRKEAESGVILNI